MAQIKWGRRSLGSPLSKAPGGPGASPSRKSIVDGEDDVALIGTLRRRSEQVDLAADGEVDASRARIGECDRRRGKRPERNGVGEADPGERRRRTRRNRHGLLVGTGDVEPGRGKSAGANQ